MVTATPTKTDRRFLRGILTHDNVKQVAECIATTLAGKLFAVCAMSTGSSVEQPRLYTNQILRAAWVDKVSALVRFSESSSDNDVISLTFADYGHVYTYTAHLSKKAKFETRFVFDSDGFLIEDALENGEFRKLRFQVQGPIHEFDDRFCTHDLAVNLWLAIRREDMTEAMVGALNRKIPQTHAVWQKG